MNEKLISDKLVNLDVELSSIVKYFLNTEQIQKAINFVKSQIKSIEIIKNLTDLFDEYGHRGLAIEL
jgi:hypothetical protein